MVSEETLRYLDSLGQRQKPNMWEQPEEVARAVLESEPDENGVTTPDTTKSNFNPPELRSYRAIGGTINLSVWAEENHGWDLSKARKFLKQENIVTSIPSRAKNGWGTAMAKTQTNVNRNEIREEAAMISNNFDNRKGFMDKIRSRIPLLGNKE